MDFWFMMYAKAEGEARLLGMAGVGIGVVITGVVTLSTLTVTAVYLPKLAYILDLSILIFLSGGLKSYQNAYNVILIYFYPSLLLRCAALT